MTENPDRPEDQTAILERHAPGLAWIPRIVREKLTPKIAWAVIATLLTTAATFYDRARTAERDIARLKESVGKLENQREALDKINTQLAVLDEKMDNINSEVERQREWRERVEDQAELPPHTTRRRR